jgi:hypothetical protein
MNPSSTPLADDASALLEAALRVHADPSVGTLTASLVDVEQALRALSGATEDAAHALVPPAGIDESVATRYARAADEWPSPFGTPAPSYERQAELLGALDDARATLHAAAECCRRAREILISTVR